MSSDTDRIRNRGIVYTPQNVANCLVRKCLKERTKENIRVLEPSVGDGAFLRAFQKNDLRNCMITAIDIDPNVMDLLNFEFPNVDIKNENFLTFAANNTSHQFDLIIGNPPYIRKHNFDDLLSQEQKKLCEKTGYPYGQTQHAWVSFVLASSELLSNEGLLAFIVPYEMMTVQYGQYLQTEIFTQFHRVDIFIPNEKAFKAIEQDAVVFIASKTKKKPPGIFLNRVDNLEKLIVKNTRKITYEKSENLSVDLKSFLFDSNTTKFLHKLRSNTNIVSDYCNSAAGTVTAANDYFILRKKEVSELDLLPWARGIIRKGSMLPDGPSLDNEHFSFLSENEPSYLIDFCYKGAPPLSEAANNYISLGEDKNIHLRYKTKRRNPWYKLPVVPVSEGLFFKRCHLFPRLCSNEAGVLATDTAYQIRMKPTYSIEGLCYSFYNSLTLLFAEIDGRFYGGGVLELTPNEFKNLPLEYIEPSQQQYVEFLKSFTSDKESIRNTLAIGDARLLSNGKVTSDELAQIKNALKALQSHRLRHGNYSVS